MAAAQKMSRSERCNSIAARNRAKKDENVRLELARAERNSQPNYPKEQFVRLDKRLGVLIGAVKERARLKARYGIA